MGSGRSAELLRALRQQLGLSVRAASARAEVARSTWGEWESGARPVTADVLAGVLRCFGEELGRAPAAEEPSGAAGVRHHLTRSLSDRARAALGEQLDAVTTACRGQPRRLTGPAEVGVWVPHVTARGPLALPRVGPTTGLVRVRLDVEGEVAAAWVAPPDQLLLAGAHRCWPALVTAARMLHGEAPLDAGRRRLPPHRQPDEARERADLASSILWEVPGGPPVDERDSRAWRLDAAASLDEQGHLARHLPQRRLRGQPSR
jgi:transcriptional regulator with XRE-family HTH domain